MEPMVIARLVQIAAAGPGQRALVVGAGSGYGAALLAACGASVTALEQDPALMALARAVLPHVAPGISLVEGPLADGWKAAAPYDIVLIEGAVPEIPAAILAQLRAEGGRLVTVLKPGARIGQAVLCSSAGGGRLEPQPVFDCAIPVLPMLQRAPGFVF
jgi:protein-L-isoaspartate(D-aspartate) O-methyltransferase